VQCAQKQTDLLMIKPQHAYNKRLTYKKHNDKMWLH